MNKRVGLPNINRNYNKQKPDIKTKKPNKFLAFLSRIGGKLLEQLEPRADKLLDNALNPLDNFISKIGKK